MDMVKHVLQFLSIGFVFCVTAGIHIACAQKCIDVPPNYDYGTKKQNISLELTSLKALPNDIVVASGHFRGISGVLHPALFFSKDSGGSWSAQHIFLDGYGINNVTTAGLSNIWAIITFQQEGLHNPEYLLKSTDSGQHWCVSELSFIRLNAPLISVDEFKFYDSKRGLLTVKGSIGNSKTYITQDGGQTWKTLWEIKANSEYEIETDYVNPGHEQSSSHVTPLWFEKDSYYKIQALLRFSKNEQYYSIQEYNLGSGSHWITRSRLNRFYTIKNNTLSSHENFKTD